MINSIYELENGRQYIVIREKNIDNRKFVLLAECNVEQDSVNTEGFILKEVITSNDELYFDNIDSEMTKKVLPIILGEEKEA